MRIAVAALLLLTGCATLGTPFWRSPLRPDEVGTVTVTYAPVAQVVDICEAWSGQPRRPGCVWIERALDGQLIRAFILCPHGDDGRCLDHELRHVREPGWTHE